MHASGVLTVIRMVLSKCLFCRGKGSGLDGEETSRDSDTSPNFPDRRITGRFDPEETEAANMLGKLCYLTICLLVYTILITTVIVIALPSRLMLDLL